MTDSSHIYFHKTVGFKDQAWCVRISPGEISCSRWALSAIAHVACLPLHPQQWWKSCSFHLTLEDNQSQQNALQIKPLFPPASAINWANIQNLMVTHDSPKWPAKYWWESVLWSPSSNSCFLVSWWYAFAVLVVVCSNFSLSHVLITV